MARRLRKSTMTAAVLIRLRRPNDKVVTIRCPIEATCAAVAGKWKLVILWHLRAGALRFGELRHAIPGATQNMLTAQLRGLEADGLLSRTVYTQVPRKVEYALTTFGRTLEPLIDEMYRWGEMYIATRRGAMRPRKPAGEAPSKRGGRNPKG